MPQSKVPRPSAGMKVKKDGTVTFQSNVDQVKFSMDELIDAANRDVGKYIRKIAGEKLVELYKDEYVKGNIVEDRTGDFKPQYARKAVQYWARKKEHDLIIGFKIHSWYGTHQELGDFNYPKKGVLRNTVFENVGTIRTIQSKYLKELAKEIPNIPKGASDDD